MSEYHSVSDAQSTSDYPELHFPGEPNLAILWAAAWAGGTVGCLFQHKRLSYLVCSGTAGWRLLRRSVAASGDLLENPANGATRMIVLIRHRDKQITAVTEEGPLMTMPIPPGPDIEAGQAWMERWAALKGPSNGNGAGS